MAVTSLEVMGLLAETGSLAGTGLLAETVFTGAGRVPSTKRIQLTEVALATRARPGSFRAALVCHMPANRVPMLGFIQAEPRAAASITVRLLSSGLLGTTWHPEAMRNRASRAERGSARSNVAARRTPFPQAVIPASTPAEASTVLAEATPLEDSMAAAVGHIDSHEQRR